MVNWIIKMTGGEKEGIGWLRNPFPKTREGWFQKWDERQEGRLLTGCMPKVMCVREGWERRREGIIERVFTGQAGNLCWVYIYCLYYNRTTKCCRELHTLLRAASMRSLKSSNESPAFNTSIIIKFSIFKHSPLSSSTRSFASWISSRTPTYKGC